MSEFKLSEIQAKAILDMRLQKLTGLERDKIKAEYEELMKTIEYLKSILSDKAKRMEIIKDELIEMKDKYGDDFYLKQRPRKHRYIYIVGSKGFKKFVMARLKYKPVNLI